MKEYKRYYVTGSFLSTDRVVYVGGKERIAMWPTLNTLRSFGKLYESVGQTAAQFNAVYNGEPIEIYSASADGAVEAVETFIQKKYGRNIYAEINAIGAEFVEGIGIAEPAHTLFLYEIADSTGRLYYVLTASLAMLEMTWCLLNNGITGDGMFTSKGYKIESSGLDKIICKLASEYFRRDIYPSDFIDGTDILPMVLDIPDYCLRDFKPVVQKIEKDPHNKRIAMLICTNIYL